jgi:hypothetical protein
MKLKNTSVYPTAALKVLLNLVLRSEQHEVKYLKFINITNCTTSAYRGRCNGRRILLRIGTPDKFSGPIHNQYRKRSPAYDVGDWKEGFVSLFAHEAEHARHFAYKMGVDEIACEHAAVRGLKALREQREMVDAKINNAVEQERLDQGERERKKADANSPEAKLVKLDDKIASWKKKLETAETYLKKYEKQRRRLLAKNSPDSSIAQAAKKL